MHNPFKAYQFIPAFPPEALTSRELEVFRLIAGGQTNSEIAQQLALALATVRSHTRSIYRKLGVQRRAQAIAVGDMLGLLTAVPAPTMSQPLPPAALSGREREVLQLIAAGQTNSEIADELIISRETVRSHARNICRKLGVQRRTQAIAAGRVFGLV